MKITKILPNTVTYRAVADRSDKDRYKCAWADFTLEFDFRRLSIHSDSGDYGYCWGHSDKDSIMNLLSRVEEHYLLSRIANQDVLDIHASKLAMIENVRRYKDKYDIKNIKSVISEIANIPDMATEETYLRSVNMIVPKADWETIPVIKRYPYNAQIVCEFFIKYVQPIIKKEFEDSLVIKTFSYTGDSSVMALSEIENAIDSIDGASVVRVKIEKSTRSFRNSYGKSVSEEDFEKLKETDDGWFDDYDFIVSASIETKLSDDDLIRELTNVGLHLE